MTVSEKLQVVVAVLLGVFGIVMLAGVCIQVLEGTSKYSLVTDMLLTVLFVILPLVCAAWLYKRVRQAVTRRTVEDSEKIAPQGVFPELLGLLERCTHCAVAEAKLGINATNAVQDRGMADVLALMPDEHTEHDTHKEQPPDFASDHGYLPYWSGRYLPYPYRFFLEK